MPFLILCTNLAKSKISPSFVQSTTKMLATVLNKPEKSIWVHVQPDQFLSYGGSDEPCAYCQVRTIARLNAETNAQFAPPITEHLKAALDIPGSNINISFVDLDPTAIAYDGKLMR